nr:hypothetical protein [Tanacetum cinerariifolium]
MLNPLSDIGVESIFTMTSSQVVSLEPPTPIMTPSTIATITTSGEAPIPPPTIPSIILENLPTFNSAFRFEERLRLLETFFYEYRQTNQFVDVVSAIPGIVHQYMDQQIKEAKVLKGLVKDQVKEQVSRILPRIEESVNATLEAEVLTRSSHSSRTSYAVAADLSEMELKKILIEKMEGNKSIQRSDEQRNLYKALVEAYEADKAILDTYGDSTILKRRREDDDQEGPSAGPNRGSKRQKEGGADDQPIVQTSQHPEWFSQPRKPPSPDRAWNTALPAAQGDAQSWISDLAKQADARSSFNELLDTPIDFSIFIMHRLNEDDNQEGPSAGSNRGSKRQKEGGQHASASTPSEKATEGAGRSTTGSQSREMSASETAFAKEPVQTTYSLQRENDEFLRNIDENMKKVLKGLVKNQVKEQVSRILPRIEESVNATLEAEVLTRSSYSSRTSYAIVADLSEMELKKILIEKMEGNKSIQRFDEQRNLYKALVKAYEADKAILDTYGDSTILKRRREDDDQEGPSAGPNQGSKRQKEREEPVQTTCQMEETSHPVYETSADDQPIVQTSQHPELFSQPRRPPLPDRAWNTAMPAAQGDAQSWISNLAKQADARSSFNELLDTPIDFSNFIMH